MQTAAATLAGNAFGAKDAKRMKSLAARFIPLEIALMAGSGALLFLGAPALMRIFSSSADVVNFGATVLRMVAVYEPFYGFSIIVEGFMMGVGKTKTPFLFNIAGMWGIRIIGTFFCINLFHLGLISAWACMIAHNLLLFFLYFICYKKESGTRSALMLNFPKKLYKFALLVTTAGSCGGPAVVFCYPDESVSIFETILLCKKSRQFKRCQDENKEVFA